MALELTCRRCGYLWHQKGEQPPKTCASCQSPFWQKELTPYWRAVRLKNKKNKLKGV